jgi:hypothetical protein
MSQHDMNIANQTFPATRADINDALQALASLSSGDAAPSTTYANMLWYDTLNNILKMRAEPNDAWINLVYIDQINDEFQILDDTQVVDTSGNQTGLIGDQEDLAWETGTSTTESLVSPAKLAAAISAQVSTSIPDLSVTTNKLANGAVTSGKLATNSVRRDAIYTGTNSVSYSLTNTSQGQIKTKTVTLDAYGFLPAVTGGAERSITGTSADAPAITLTHSSTGTVSGAVKWRYIRS